MAAVPLPLLLGDERAGISAYRPLPELDASPHPFASVAWRSARPLQREAFDRFLDSLRPAVFRAKGLIQFGQEPAATLLQMVGSYRSLTKGPDWVGMTPATELVFIGLQATIERAQLAERLTACERHG